MATAGQWITGISAAGLIYLALRPKGGAFGGLMALSRRQRSSPSRGWRRSAPKTREDRRALAKSCGAKCFLDPKRLKFPICPKCRGTSCSCKPDCRALSAAYNRANQYGHRKVAAHALRLAKREGCRWTG